MAELLLDAWPDENMPPEEGHPHHRTHRPPVTENYAVVGVLWQASVCAVHEVSRQGGGVLGLPVIHLKSCQELRGYSLRGLQSAVQEGGIGKAGPELVSMQRPLLQ